MQVAEPQRPVFEDRLEPRNPADPPTYRSTVLTWRQGDTIPLTAKRTLRVPGVHDDDSDEPPVLVVEDLPGEATSDAS